ncbi:hypothetical protein V2G26_004211 [Clonostachys chloroleuca]
MRDPSFGLIISRSSQTQTRVACTTHHPCLKDYRKREHGCVSRVPPRRKRKEQSVLAAQSWIADQRMVWEANLEAEIAASQELMALVKITILAFSIQASLGRKA